MTVAISRHGYLGAERVHANLRAGLYALASAPWAQRSPGRALAKLRAIVDIARACTDQAADAPAATEETHAASIRLTDAAVIGLLHFARACLDDTANSMIAPVCCVAVGLYPNPPPRSPLAGGLVILIEQRADRRALGRTIAGFIMHGMADLGFEVETHIKTVDDAARLLALPTFEAWRRQR